MRPAIATQAPRSFVDVLKDADQHALDLRDLLLELMGSPPGDEKAWIELMTEPGTAKALGRLLILTSKNAAWIMETTRAIGDTITQIFPAGTGPFLQAFVAGEVEAEMACTCGECVPCGLKRERGDEEARAELVRQNSPTGTRRRSAGLVDPRGQPLT